MRNTVATALSDRQLKEDAVVPFLNKELIPLAREMRTGLNLQTFQVYTASTAGTATFTTIWTSDAMATNSTWRVYVDVLGRASAGAAKQSSYLRVGLFTNEAGTVAQVGATQSIWTIESAAAADVQFLVSGQTILFQVKDDGVSTYAWKALVMLLASDEV